jgi:hypothetical protein
MNNKEKVKDTLTFDELERVMRWYSPDYKRDKKDKELFDELMKLYDKIDHIVAVEMGNSSGNNFLHTYLVEKGISEKIFKKEGYYY